MSSLKSVTLAAFVALAIASATPSQVQTIEPPRTEVRVENIWQDELPILRKYSEVIDYSEHPSLDRKLIIYVDDNHNNPFPKRSTLKSMSDLYSSDLLDFVGLEGVFDNQEVTLPDSYRTDLPDIANANWDKVANNIINDFGTQLIEIPYPGLRVYGVDDSELFARTQDLVREYDNLENFVRWRKQGKTSSEILQEFKEKLDPLIYERSVVMANYLDQDIQPDETGLISVGRDHVQDIIKILDGKLNYIVLIPQGAGITPSTQSDYLKKFKEN